MATSLKRVLASAALPLFLAFLTACDTPMEADVTEAYGDLTRIPVEIVQLTNSDRQAHGLTALAESDRLAAAARIQAEQMAAAGRLEHTLPEARYPTLVSRIEAVGYRSPRVAENIASGYWDVDGVMHGWMTSPGHRSNILHRDLREIGVAVALAANGRIYYTTVFGTP